MAPMTRSRAHGPGRTPTELMATYYAQRASAGLIVTEGIQPSLVGQGYPDTPGLHSRAQVTAWRRVTDAVHERGGLIFAQLMHTGRVGHPSVYEQDLWPVGPSPVAADGVVYTREGPKPLVVPLALDEAGIAQTVVDFAAAAVNAVDAGFDGIELHAGSGYLLHQFLATNANRRGDRWGGDVTGRVRFPVTVAKVVSEAIGPDRTAIRITPGSQFNDMIEDGSTKTYKALVDALDPLGLAYLHVAEGPDTALTSLLRERWAGTFILNPAASDKHSGPEALDVLRAGAADMVSFAALFLANPDLPERLRREAPLNRPERSTYYGGDHRGYTDYPTLDEVSTSVAE